MNKNIYAAHKNFHTKAYMFTAPDTREGEGEREDERWNEGGGEKQTDRRREGEREGGRGKQTGRERDHGEREGGV